MGKAAADLTAGLLAACSRTWHKVTGITHVCLQLQVKLQEVVLDDLFDLPALNEYELFSMGRGCYR